MDIISTNFLAAQAEAPFDPAPMLILADALEESGDPVGAAVLRGLVERGTLSVVALAWQEHLVSQPYEPDFHLLCPERPGRPARPGWHGRGDGYGDDGYEDEFENQESGLGFEDGIVIDNVWIQFLYEGIGWGKADSHGDPTDE